jgi:pSer/pThr/pTyr-binding forkhead associated (FHA) protein
VLADGRTAELAIKKPSTIFGRADDADVKVPLPGVSRHHCKLTVTPEGDIAVQDMGSSNGTFVNQDRIERQPLAGGDLISFGGMVFVVRVNGSPADDEIDAEVLFEDGLPDEPEHPGRVASSPPPGAKPLVPAGSADESSVFEFDFDDDEDEQPPL